MGKKAGFSSIKKDIEQLSESKREIALSLCEKAQFMEYELKKLQEFIAENGVTETYQNGANQFGKKKSTEVEVYNTMVKNYSAIMNQINNILPIKDTTTDELMEFLQGSDDK